MSPVRNAIAVFAAGMLAGAALLLAACGEGPQPPLRVGVNPWVGYDPLVLARDRKLLDSSRVRVVELGSNTESMRQLRNGVLEAAALTLDEALRLADEGTALRIVALLDVSHGADAVLAAPRIAGPADLKGKRVAVEEGAVGAMVLARLLQAGGLAAADVTVQRVEASQHEGALRAGRVDAVVTFEPMKSRLEAQGFRTIFDSRQMPGEIVDVLVVRPDVLAGRPAEVTELLAGWERGREALVARPEAAAALLAPGADLTPDQYLATLRGLRFHSLADSARLLARHPAPLAFGDARPAETLLRLGLIGRPPDWRALLAPEAAASALSRMGAQP